MSRSVSAPSSVTNTSPCWNGDIVPGSTLMYGSSLMLVTRMPRDSRIAAREAAAMPFPREETTPPVTNTYFVIDPRRVGMEEFTRIRAASQMSGGPDTRIVANRRQAIGLDRRLARGTRARAVHRHVQGERPRRARGGEPLRRRPEGARRRGARPPQAPAGGDRRPAPRVARRHRARAPL